MLMQLLFVQWPNQSMTQCASDLGNSASVIYHHCRCTSPIASCIHNHPPQHHNIPLRLPTLDLVPTRCCHHGAQLLC